MRRRSLTLAAALAACALAAAPSFALAAGTVHRHHDIASVKHAVSAPGTYVVVVSVRAGRRAAVKVYVPGRAVRVVHTAPRAVEHLSYLLHLSAKALDVRAVSAVRSVRLAMTLALQSATPHVSSTPAPATPTPTPVTPTPATPTPTTTPASTPPAASTPASPPQAQSPYTNLIFDDEFSGAAGAPPDPTKWTEYGNSGCGGSTNYAATASNAYQDGSGHLVLQATDNGGYASAQLDTIGKFSTTYGEVEASMELPAGDSLCSAFWMVGNGPNPPSACWPSCGEIDILEALSNLPTTAIFTLHGPTSATNYQQFEGTATGLPNMTTGFHTYGVIWTPDTITWTVDGVAYASESREALEAANGAGSWVYDEPFHIILDLAIGNWQEPVPDSATPFPARMLVDWVRVYGS